MKEKKNPKYNLERKRVLFLQFGFVFSFLFVLMAFEYRVPMEEAEDIDFVAWDVTDELIPVTFREPEKPNEPPKIKKLVLLDPLVVDDDDEVDPYEPEDSFGDPGEDIPLPVFDDVIEDDEVTTFVIVEDMPIFNPSKNRTFEEGQIDLFRTVQKMVKYPVIAQESCIEGKVFVRFVVTKNGDIGNIEITRSVDPSLDKEVIRVIKKLPKFKAGMQRNKAVPVYYSAYVNFKLQ